MSAKPKSTSIIPPQYLPYLANSVAAIAIIPTTIGLTAIINPSYSLTQLHFQAEADKEVVHGIIRLLGSRIFAIGISTFALWHANRKGQASYYTLGACFLPFSLFLFADGWVVRELVGEGHWGHWAFVPVVSAVGLGLMGVY